MKRVLSRITAQKRGWFALAVFAGLVCAALLSWVWLPYSPTAADGRNLWASPSLTHVLGTDGSGRDILSRLLVGSRTTILVSTATGILSGALGLLLAWLTTLGPRWFREPVTVVVDVLIAFPTLLIAMMLAAVYGSGIPVVIAALSLGYGVSLARVVRGELAQVSREDYVLAARAVGLKPVTILWRHVMSGAAPVITVQLSLVMGLAVLAESSLSYLGFGAPPSVPSWGRMLAETQSAITVYPLTVVWPGLAITLVVLAFYVFGDVLRTALDPNQKVGRLNLEAIR